MKRSTHGFQRAAAGSAKKTASFTGPDKEAACCSLKKFIHKPLSINGSVRHTVKQFRRDNRLTSSILVAYTRRKKLDDGLAERSECNAVISDVPVK
jgi:hypothetical protein